MRYLVILLLFVACTNDKLESICYKYEGHLGGQVWQPNGFTPNGDGLNDRFRVFPVYIEDSTGYYTNVTSITDFTAKKDGRLVFQRDTMFSSSGIHYAWDLTDQDGATLFCEIDVSYTVNSIDGTYRYEYPICSYLCGKLGISTVDYKLLRFEDMLDPVRGFVAPSSDVPCD